MINQETNIAGERIKSFIERVERLEQEKTAISEDIKEIYAEVKAVGFEVKIIKKIVSLRKIEKERREEESQLLEMYLSAIGEK